MRDKDRSKPLETPDDWDRFMRERKRAEFAISNWAYVKFILTWCFFMLVAHLMGRF